MYNKMFGGYKGKDFSKLEALLNSDSPRQVARNLADVLLNSNANNNFDAQRPAGPELNRANIASRLEQIFQNDVQSLELARKLCNILNENAAERQEYGRNPYEGNHSLLYKLEHIYKYEPPDQQFKNQLLRFIGSNQDRDLNDGQAASYLTRILQAYLGEYVNNVDGAGGVSAVPAQHPQNQHYRDWFWEAHPHLNRLQNRSGKTVRKQSSYTPVLDIIHEEVVDLSKATGVKSNRVSKERNVPNRFEEQAVENCNYREKRSTSQYLSEAFSERNRRNGVCPIPVSNKPETSFEQMKTKDTLTLSRSIPKICCEPRPKARNLVPTYNITKMCDLCTQKKHRYSLSGIPKTCSDQFMKTVKPVCSRKILKVQSDQSLMKWHNFNNLKKPVQKIPTQVDEEQVAKQCDNLKVKKNSDYGKLLIDTDIDEMKTLQANMDVTNCGAKPKEHLLNKMIPGISNESYQYIPDVEKNNNSNRTKPINIQHTENNGSERVNYDDLPSCSFKKPNIHF